MYRIEEFPEIWADACLRDSEGRFMFLSLYGRDGSLMRKRSLNRVPCAQTMFCAVIMV